MGRTFSPTRWFGFYDMWTSILKYENEYAQLFDTNTEDGKANVKGLKGNIKSILNSIYIIPEVKVMAEVLAPLMVVIKHSSQTTPLFLTSGRNCSIFIIN